MNWPYRGLCGMGALFCGRCSCEGVLFEFYDVSFMLNMDQGVFVLVMGPRTLFFYYDNCYDISS